MLLFPISTAPKSTNYNVIKKAFFQTIKQEYKILYPNSPELLLKFEEHPQHNLRWSVFTAGYTAVIKLSPCDFTEWTDGWFESRRRQ